VATFYLDFENGNDSNSGTTFANRWKTITSGATAARIAPGDEVRIMKSPDPVSLGINGTFTQNSNQVTLASAVTANIDLCEVAWTASANVTATTTTTNVKQGINAANISIAAGFTTGLVAYRATGLLNLSAFQNISFWLRTSIAVAANSLRIDLCSDTAGATPVHSFTIDQAMAANVYKAFTFKTGAALSTSIQSVALTALIDPGTVVVNIDNIIACNDLHFNALIGTTSSATALTWYPIRGVNATALTIDHGQNTLIATTPRGWADATTTTTVYVRDTIRITALQTTPEAGTSAARITFTGGWDRTNMSTQDGVTFLNSDLNLMATRTINAGSQGWVTFRRLAILWGAIPIDALGQHVALYDCGFYGYATGPTYANEHALYNLEFCSAVASPGLTLGAAWADTIDVISTNGNGINQSSTSLLQLKNFTAKNNSGSGLSLASAAIGQNWKFENNNSGAFSSTAYCECSGVTCTGSGVTISNSALMRLHNITGAILSGSNSARPIYYSRSGSFVAGMASGGVSNTYRDTTALAHSPATRSYEHNPSANSFSERPEVQPLQPFAVNGGSLVTFKIWARRSSTSAIARVRLKGYVTPGVDADVTTEITAAINTWEELTVTCTPSAAGVVQIDLESYVTNGVSNTVYFSDATVTQA